METQSPNTTTLSMPSHSSRQEEIDYLNSVSHDIQASYIWVVFCLGFPGNVFSIITVIIMRSMTPATFSVAFLALSDGITLLLKLIFHQFYYHEAHLGSVFCKVEFLPSYTATVANWALVLICAERFVAVCFPLKRNLIFTKQRCYISVIVISVVFFFIFGPMYWTMRDALPDGSACGTLNEYLSFWITGWYWINICLNLLIPLPIIVFLTVLIIRGLRKSRRDRRSILHNGAGHEENNKRLMREMERLERTITLMLNLAAVVFAVISLPTVVYLLAYEKSDDELVEARWNLFDQIQYLCIDSSHAINFFLYFLSAKKFREQFIYLITCHRWPRELSKVKGNNDVTHSMYGTKYTIAKSNEDVSHI